MGYYTRFELKVHEGDRNIEDILKESQEFDGLDYAMDESGEGEEPVKWYSHVKDMLSLSEKYPDVVFSLKGDGEEQGDSWFKYFRDGKMQECYAKIEYDPYDESKLK